jgi:hypothetical protein
LAGVKSALGITPETMDFVTEVAASDMFEIHRANVPWQRRTEGCSFRQSPAGRPYEDIEPVKAASAKHAAKLQRIIGHEFAKLMTE